MKEKIVDFYWWLFRLWYYSLRPIMLYRNIKYGIGNLYYYFPVIWRDRDWDHTYLVDLLYYKFSNMEKHFRNYGIHIGADRDADNIRLAKLLCKRITEDEYYKNPYKRIDGKFTDQEQNDVDLLCDIIRKHLREWWD